MVWITEFTAKTSGLTVMHVGGLTSLSLQGLTHYARMGKGDKILVKGGVYISQHRI